MPSIVQSTITPTSLRVEKFSLGKATGRLELDTVFNRASAVPACPVTNVDGDYHQHAYGCALEHALVVMSGSTLAPADAKAVQRFMSWLAPNQGERERLGNPVLRRITALGVMHAAVNELLNADSSNQKLIQCEIKLRQSIVDIAVASGKCKSPPQGGDAGGRTTLVAEHMTTAGKCLRECVSMLDTQAFAGAVVRAVLPEALAEAIGDRLGAEVEKRMAEGETSLEVVRVLNAIGAEKVRAAVQGLSCKGNFESVQNGILVLLEIPELVVGPQEDAQPSKGPDQTPGQQPPEWPKLPQGGQAQYTNSPTTVNNNFSDLAKVFKGNQFDLKEIRNLIDSAWERGYEQGGTHEHNKRLLALSEDQCKVIEGQNREISELKGRTSELEQMLVEQNDRLARWSNGSGKLESRDWKSSKIVFGDSSIARAEVHVGEPDVGHARSVLHQGGVSTSRGTSTEKHATTSIIHMDDETVSEILPPISEASVGVLSENRATTSIIHMNDEAVNEILPLMPATARAVPARESVVVDRSDVQVLNGTYGTHDEEFKDYVKALNGETEGRRQIRSNGYQVGSERGLPNTTVIATDVVDFVRKNVSDGASRGVGSRRVQFLPMDIQEPEFQQVYRELAFARISGVESPLRFAIEARKNEEYSKRLLNPKQPFVDANAQRSNRSADEIHADLSRQLEERLAAEGGGSEVSQETTDSQESSISQSVLSQGNNLGPMKPASQVITTSNIFQTSSGPGTRQSQLPVKGLIGEYKQLLWRTRPGGVLSDRNLATAAPVNAELYDAERLGKAPPNDVSLEASERRQTAAKSTWRRKVDPPRNSSEASALALFSESGGVEVRKPQTVRFNLNPGIELGSAGQSVGGSTSSQGSASNEAAATFLEAPSFLKQIRDKANTLKRVGSEANGQRVTGS
ncbi:hypothetical protein [Stenotrophomonas sp. PS02289]|uniref:hypothetical protein n=1 Tax=Stenotrophomonas sp. PS02289 TaxID=2991422 RepID=UPI00249AE619|nr:hypothetical protein [Stenotrophomonas sp. PS02289]